MKDKFVPFDKFERECLQEGKTLHQTMQESCVSNLVPKEPPCVNNCVPYWQPTGGRQCLDIGVVEIEETDGCENFRFTRVPELVVWEDTSETRCDEARNRIQKQQVNQCGDSRWVTTEELCCTPNWQDIPNEINCSHFVVRQMQVDGCGNTRLHSTGNPVTWLSTSETQCIDGMIYQIRQVNQCGEYRWAEVPGGCPDTDIEISANIREGMCLNETIQDAGYNVGIGIMFRPNGVVEYRTATNTLKGGTWYDAMDINPNTYEVRFTGVATHPLSDPTGTWLSMGVNRFFYNQNTLTTDTGSTWIDGFIEIRNRNTGKIVYYGSVKAVNSRSPVPGYCDTWPNVPQVPPSV